MEEDEFAEKYSEAAGEFLDWLMVKRMSTRPEDAEGMAAADAITNLLTEWQKIDPEKYEEKRQRISRALDSYTGEEWEEMDFLLGIMGMIAYQNSDDRPPPIPHEEVKRILGLGGKQ